MGKLGFGFRFCFALLVSIFLIPYPNTSVIGEVEGSGLDYSNETKHFILVYKTGEARLSELDSLAQFSEAVFERLADFIGKERLPTKRITISLEGSAEYVEGGQRKYKIPYVDATGIIHLFRYREGYGGLLPHEMVHSFRVQTGTTRDTFFEEGIAEFMAATLFESQYSFPRYGFSLSLVSGALLQTGKKLPLDEIYTKSHVNNLLCQAQLYPLRADFMAYIIHANGAQWFFENIYDARHIDASFFEQKMGKEFSALDADWTTDIAKRFSKIAEGDQKMKNYFEKTPIRFMNFCESN